MTEPPRYPAQPNTQAPPPSSTPAHSSVAFTPQTASVADDSDADFDLTPPQSPGGPHYDDLPPSYDDAQQQAVHDARDGVAPIDPNQIEAHRLTLSEDPNGPEIWEYRVRGDNSEHTDEQEHAPEYEAHASPLSAMVPVQHVQSSETIPVGRIGNKSTISDSSNDSVDALLDTALQFTRHEPDAGAQHAPRLLRYVAIPPETSMFASRSGSSRATSVQFLRAYAKSLHARSVRPVEFTEFLDGLNALCVATNLTAGEMLDSVSAMRDTPNLVNAYLDGANEAFFAPRGLRVSLRSLSDLLQSLSISLAGLQRRDARFQVIDSAATAEVRAHVLHPRIEALDTNVPEPSARTVYLQQMCARRANADKEQSSTGSRNHGNDDPPHSIPNQTHRTTGHSESRFGNHSPGSRPPSGPPGLGRLCPPGYTPSGSAGFESSGRGGQFFPHGPFGHYRRGRGHGAHGAGRGHRGPPRVGNDMAAMGQDMGKWGAEFGKKMGQWGQQFGKDMSIWGQQIGREASAWSQNVSSGASGSAPGVRGTFTQASQATDHDLPPSYDAGQDTRIIAQDTKSLLAYSTLKMDKGKGKAKEDLDGDDSSSISSDSSESGSDSDSDDEDLPDSEAIFLKRMKSIDKQAEELKNKGKKSVEEIERERATAIADAQGQKTLMDLKIEHKLSNRAARRDLKRRGRELKREHRQTKRELRAAHDGKGKGKAKKSKEWKAAKKEHKDKKQALRKEKLAARKEWREGKMQRRQERREGKRSGSSEGDPMDTMVWVVIEDLRL